MQQLLFLCASIARCSCSCTQAAIMDVFNKLDEWADPRSKHFPIINSPTQAFAILAAYILISTKVGPAFMKNRKAFILRQTIQAYNIFQVVACSIFTVLAAIVAYKSRLTFFCDPIASSTDYWTVKLVEFHWYYFMFKFIDFLDTLFFILRKKNEQITFLHIYHHSIMFLLTWSYTRYAPGGQTVLTGIINSFVHVWMYTYYLIASWGPEYKKYLWWKKHLTQLQMVQFLILGVQVSVPFFIDCGFPKALALLVVIQVLVFIYLFGKFYYGEYIKNRSPNTQKRK